MIFNVMDASKYCLPYHTILIVKLTEITSIIAKNQAI